MREFIVIAPIPEAEQSSGFPGSVILIRVSSDLRHATVSRIDPTADGAVQTRGRPAAPRGRSLLRRGIGWAARAIVEQALQQLIWSALLAGLALLGGSILLRWLVELIAAFHPG